MAPVGVTQEDQAHSATKRANGQPKARSGTEDHESHKYCFNIKGDRGSRFCSLCKIVFMAKTQQDQEEHMEIMEVSSFIKVNQLDLTTSSWSRMTARISTETVGAFREWEQATGITHSSHAIKSISN